MTTGHAASMAHTYVSGPFAAVVDAGGTGTLMNLGWTPDPAHRHTPARRQVWLADLVIARLQLRTGQIVADIGCGRGGLTRRIVDRHPGTGAVGINVDHRQLVLARSAGSAPGVGYATGSADRLPLGTTSVDAAVAVELLGHLQDKHALWAELGRVVRPGGRIVVAAITLRRPLDALDAPTRAHVARLAGYFAERADDLLQASDVCAELRRRGWEVRDEDLSAGVYGPRHEDMCAVLRGLDAPQQHVREAARSAVRSAWGADPDVLADFLRASTSTPAQHLYEYHLITATTPRRTADPAP